MVGGLVQDQKVNLFIHQHTQPQPGLLAAGKGAYGFEHILPLEQEGAQPVPGHLGGQVLFVEHGVVQAPLRMVKADDLGQVAPLDGGSKLDPAAAVLLPQQALEEGGLSGAVVAQKGNALAALHVEVHIGKQHPVPIGLGHIFHFEHHVAGKILFPEGGLHGFFRFGPLGFLNPLHPVLNGHGPAVEGPVVDAPALHPLHGIAQLLELGLLLLVLLQLQIKPGLLFFHVEGIVAGVEFRVTVGDLDDPLGHLIDEIPVVGDDQHRALKALDVALQPLHTAQIQVVGGLVQQQNIRLFQQKPGKIDPGLLAAGQAVKFLGPLGRRDAQAVADLIHIHIHIIAAAGLEAVYQGIVFPELLSRGPLGHGLLQGLHFPFGGGQLRKCGAQHVLHGIARRETGNLRDETQFFIGVHVDLPAVIVHFAGEDFEKGGFAAAVAAQNGHPLPFLNVKGQVLQQVFPDDKEFFNVFYGYINHFRFLQAPVKGSGALLSSIVNSLPAAGRCCSCVPEGPAFSADAAVFRCCPFLRKGQAP